MKKQTTKKHAPAATPKAAAVDAKPKKKCRAAEVGHRSCDCNGPDCGYNMHDA